MPSERLTDLVVSIKYDYSDKGLKQASTDIEKFNVKTSDNLNKTNSKFRDLVDYYNGISSTFSTENKKIASSMTAVNKSIDKTTTAYNKYQNAINNSKKAVKELANAQNAKDTASLRLEEARNNVYKQQKLMSSKGYGKLLNDGTFKYEQAEGHKFGAKRVSAIKAYENSVLELEKALLATENAQRNYEIASQRSTTTDEVKKDLFRKYKQEVNNTASAINKLVVEEDKFRTQQELSNQALETGSATLDISIIKLASLLRVLRTFINALKRLGTFATKFINASASWVENLNLLEVTFKDNNTEAKEFVEMASENFGLDPNSISQYVSTFKQMANAMGLANDVGTNLSETMSLLALDISSLRNVDIQTAVNDIASGLAGQVKPVRKYGFDITQYSIDALLEELGLGSYSRTMSQSNKIMARAILLLRQSTDAWGDMGKTINTFANQQRVLNDEWQITTRLIGNVLLGTIHLGDSFNDAWKSAGIATRIIWVMNAGLITLNRIIETIVPNTAELGSSVLSTASDITDALNEMEDAQDGALANFDKFNTLSSGEGENLGLGNALSELLKKETQKYMEQYEKSLENINMYADELSTKWMNALGFKQIEENGKVFWELENSMTSLNSSFALLFTTFEVFAGVVFAKFALELSKTSTSISKIKTAITGLKTAMTPTTIAIALIASALAYMYITNEDFRESVNNLLRALSASLGSIISDLSKVLNALLIPIKAVLEIVAKILTPILNAITTFLENDWSRYLLEALLALSGIVAVLVKMKPVLSAIMAMTSGEKFAVIIQGLGKIFDVLNKNLFGKGLAITGLVLMVYNISLLINHWKELKQTAQGTAGIVLGIVGAVFTLISAVLLLKGAVNGLTIAGAVAGIAMAVTSIGLVQTQLKKSGTTKFADGGYMTGGLFYAGESGTEWVGRQGNTSTIINDRQMSDIMTEAVAKGVAMGNGFGRTNNTKQAPIVVNVDGKKLFEVVEDRGRNVGKAFARV